MCETSSRLRRAVAGDREALSALLCEHAPAVRAALAGRIPRRWRSVLSIDDVLQQTFTDALLDIGTFDPDGDGAFSGWLVRIAQYNLRDAVRMLAAVKRGGRSYRVQFDNPAQSADVLLSSLTDGATKPSRHIARAEAAEILKAAMSRLPPSYRCVVRLFDLEGHDAAAVAKELGRSTGAIYMLRARAHERLRDLLGDPADFLPDNP